MPQHNPGTYGMAAGICLQFLQIPHTWNCEEVYCILSFETSELQTWNGFFANLDGKGCYKNEQNKQKLIKPQKTSCFLSFIGVFRSNQLHVCSCSPPDRLDVGGAPGAGAVVAPRAQAQGGPAQRLRAVAGAVADVSRGTRWKKKKNGEFHGWCWLRWFLDGCFKFIWNH